MQTIELWVGSIININGRVQDNRRPVAFDGDETLYRAEDGRLIVYVEDWSRWQGEPSHYSLVEATEDDLDVGGRFEALGREAGMGRALTLDEALEPREAVDG